MRRWSAAMALLLTVFVFLGCGSEDSSEWNAYFDLFQAGKKYQGTVLHVTPSQVGDVILHLEYQDDYGAQRFVEMWSSKKAAKFKEGMSVNVYVLPGGAISRATEWKLRDKKIL